MTESLDIWTRREGEGAKAFAAFQLYLELGEDRSLEKVYQKYTKSIPLLKRWSARWEWVNRAAAYDSHIAVIEEIARDRERAKRAAEIERRRLRLQDDAWMLFEELNKRARQMLSFPLIDSRSADGKTVIRAARWSFDTLPRLLEAMVKVGKIAADMDSIPEQILHIDWSTLTDEQLDRIASGESPLQVLLSSNKSIRRQWPLARPGENINEL